MITEAVTQAVWVKRWTRGSFTDTSWHDTGLCVCGLSADNVYLTLTLVPVCQVLIKVWWPQKRGNSTHAAIEPRASPELMSSCWTKTVTTGTVFTRPQVPKPTVVCGEGGSMFSVCFELDWGPLLSLQTLILNMLSIWKGLHFPCELSELASVAVYRHLSRVGR